jgi:hypothetical protein
MGFTASAAQKALAECSWDVNKALDHLFTCGDLAVKTTEKAIDHHAQIRPSAKSPAAQKNLKSQGPHSNGNVSRQSSKSVSLDSLAGESTSASGVSTPCNGTWNSPQKDLSSNGSVESLMAQPHEEKRLGLPPGLEPLPGFLISPPGLDELSAEAKQDSLPITQAKGNTSTVAEGLLVSPVAFGLPKPTSTIHVPGVPVGAVSSVMPKRRLTKVQHTWECDANCSNSQLSVEEGTFINVWLGSKTENGWIYAESLICCNRVGWLPNSMLQELPVHKQWMRVSTPCKASYQSQLSVDAGSMVLVDVSRCAAGWAYAEELSSATGRHLPGKHTSAGWVPIQCLEWAQF